MPLSVPFGVKVPRPVATRIGQCGTVTQDTAPQAQGLVLGARAGCETGLRRILRGISNGRLWHGHATTGLSRFMGR